MYLQKSANILKTWLYAIENGANLVLMRHGPKSGSNESGLSKSGRKITFHYGHIINSLQNAWFSQALIGHTEKPRTRETVQLLFPELDQDRFQIVPDFNSPPISEELQRKVDQLHLNVGRWRGYYVNHTYCFLRNLDNSLALISPEEDLHGTITEHAARSIMELLHLNRPVIFCGHSPSLELGIVRILGIDLSKLGGFLNPLDSIHLKLSSGQPDWIARINPIRDYIDAESENYMNM